jgi:NF-kappa-B inhibitor-like protein 2
MQARIYLNLGVTKEHVQQVDEALSYYDTAIKICKSNDLFELHHQCLMASGQAQSNKKDDSSTALIQFNLALEVAKRIHDKNEKMCETLLAKSALFIKNGDFQSAKQVLKKCYKLNTPNKSDGETVAKKLKIGEWPQRK